MEIALTPSLSRCTGRGGKTSRGILLPIISLLLMLAQISCDRETHGDPVALLSAGWTEYRYREFDSAATRFQACLDSMGASSDPEMRQEALYGFASANDLGKIVDATSARSAYQKAIDANPAGIWAPWAALAMVRIDDLLPNAADRNITALRQAYQTIIDRYPTQPAAEEALLYQQTTFAETLKPDDARHAASILEQFVATHPSSGFLGGAYNLLATCYQIQHLPDQRVAALGHVIDLETHAPGSTGITLSGTIWQAAVAAEFDAGDFATARKYYKRFLTDFPSDRKAWVAGRALSRMDQMDRDGYAASGSVQL